jgi:hypothetical protein
MKMSRGFVAAAAGRLAAYVPIMNTRMKRSVCFMVHLGSG